MAISPFLAFTRGAFEGYRQVLEEDRAAAAEINLENHKQKIASAANSGNMFTSIGADGSVVSHFASSEAKDQGERYIQNLSNLATTFTPEAMLWLKDNDPVRYKNINAKGDQILASFKMHETIENKDISRTRVPKDFALPEVMANPYWKNRWMQINATGKVSNEEDGKFYSVSEDAESGDVIIKGDRPNIAKNGFIKEEFKPWAQYHKNRRSDNSVTDQTAGATYYNKYQAITPFYTMQAVTPEGQPLLDINNRPRTVGMILEQIVQGGSIDDDTLAILNTSVAVYNTSEMGSKKPIGDSGLYRALELASSTYHDASGSDDPYKDIISGAGSGGQYLKTVLQLDVADREVKLTAGVEARKTVNNIRRIYEEALIAGKHPPSSQFANNVAQLFSAFFEKGNVFDQLRGLGSILQDKTLSKFGVTADASALAYMQEAYEGTASGADKGATINFYKRMLAYQMAVAIQGGTGGRTVSDQDVINMENAFGDRLFANQTIQLSVLNEIDSFLGEIIEANKRYVDSASGTVADAKAADTLHKIKTGGIDLRGAAEGGTLITERYGAILNERLNGKINNGQVRIIGNRMALEDDELAQGIVSGRSYNFGNFSIAATDDEDLARTLYTEHLKGKWKDPAIGNYFDKETGDIINQDGLDRYIEAIKRDPKVIKTDINREEQNNPTVKKRD